MPTIHIEEGQPETGWWRVTFKLSEGRFSDEALEAVRRETGGIGCFDGADPTKLSLVYSRYPNHVPTACAGLRVLQRLYPEATFTTYGTSTKEMLGDEVEQIRF